jgi:hypothetical protein
VLPLQPWMIEPWTRAIYVWTTDCRKQVKADEAPLDNSNKEQVEAAVNTSDHHHIHRDRPRPHRPATLSAGPR